MDDFSAPIQGLSRRSDPGTDTLEDVRAAIATIEAEYKAKGLKLSGRIVHACHYLPITSRLNNGEQPRNEQSVLVTPPRTPDFLPGSPEVTKQLPSLAAAAEKSSARWVLAPRRGHTTMTSGIRSLSTTHKQLIVGWTGEFRTVVNGDKARIPVARILLYTDVHTL